MKQPWSPPSWLKPGAVVRRLYPSGGDVHVTHLVVLKHEYMDVYSCLLLDRPLSTFENVGMASLYAFNTTSIKWEPL